MASFLRLALCLFAGVFLTLQVGCGADPEPLATSAPEAPAEELPPAEADAEVVDPDDLQLTGAIELKQYTVAYGGSGTMGGGTLTFEGREYPFHITGLGVGGIGASVLEATGSVYNLANPDAFPGTYGNARLGLTAGESGQGKLWLRNPDGVVIELESQMRGLALAGGVDGILIQWDEGEDSTLDRAMDETQEAAGSAIEAGADAVQDGVDNVKGWFKKEG